MLCPYCHRPVERNPISGRLTCFVHPLGHERRSFNKARADNGLPPILVGQTVRDVERYAKVRGI